MTTVDKLEEMYDAATQAGNSGTMSKKDYYSLLRDIMDGISNLEECWEDNGITVNSKRLDSLAKNVYGVLKASL